MSNGISKSAFDAIEMVINGANPIEAAAQCGTSVQTVYRHMRLQGLPVPGSRAANNPNGGTIAARVARLEAMYSFLERSIAQLDGVTTKPYTDRPAVMDTATHVAVQRDRPPVDEPLPTSRPPAADDII